MWRGSRVFKNRNTQTHEDSKYLCARACVCSVRARADPPQSAQWGCICDPGGRVRRQILMEGTRLRGQVAPVCVCVRACVCSVRRRRSQRKDRFVGTLLSEATGPNTTINIPTSGSDQVSPPPLLRGSVGQITCTHVRGGHTAKWVSPARFDCCPPPQGGGWLVGRLVDVLKK